MSGGEGERASRIGVRDFVVLAAAMLALLALPTLAANAAVTDTTLVSRASGPTGAGANGDSGTGIAVSANGRYIAFESKAGNLSDAALPKVQNVYLRDTQTGTTTLVSRATGAAGAAADADSSSPAISPVGRYVAFVSGAGNLTSDGANSFTQIYIRDTWTNKTKLVSRAEDGTLANGNSTHPSVSGNAYYVAFQSDAANLSSENDDSVSNIYVRDMQAQTTVLASRGTAPANTAADGNSYDPTIDRDGRRVAFASDANNLSDKDNDAFTNIFVRDLRFQLTTLASRATDFLQTVPADGNSTDPVLSADGRFVAFASDAPNLSTEDDNSFVNVFVRDIQGSTTTFVSRADGASGAAANAASTNPTISGDGRFVAFVSAASNLVAGDAATYDVFVRDLAVDTTPTGSVCRCTTILASRASGDAGAPGSGSSLAPALSASGEFLAFLSEADNLSTDDNDTVWNVFERQLRLTPAPVDPGPDLGTNDHSAHAGHTAAEHAGHTAAEHAGHVSPTGGPAETLFGPSVQRVDQLFVLAQVHAPGRLVVTASVKLPGGGHATKVLSFKSFRQTVVVHRIYRVRLKLSRSGLRTVKRLLKRHRRLTAVVVGQAQAATGGPWTKVTRKIRLRA